MDNLYVILVFEKLLSINFKFPTQSNKFLWKSNLVWVQAKQICNFVWEPVFLMVKQISQWLANVYTSEQVKRSVLRMAFIFRASPTRFFCWILNRRMFVRSRSVANNCSWRVTASGKLLQVTWYQTVEWKWNWMKCWIKWSTAVHLKFFLEIIWLIYSKNGFF